MSYSNTQAFRQNSPAQSAAAAAQQKLAAPIAINAFVDNLLKVAQTSEQQMALDNAHHDLESQLRTMSQTAMMNNALSVGHNQTFKVTHHVEVKGSLNQLQADPSKVVWKASAAPIQLPAPNARAILLSSMIRQTQNTYNVSLALDIEGMEANSKWTSNGIQSSFVLNPLMRQPLNTEWKLFERQNLDNFDMGSLYGWNNVTEESIRAEVKNVYSGENVTELAFPSLTVQLIQKVLPNLTEQEIVYVRDDAQTGAGSVYINSTLATKAQEMALLLYKSTSFCDPNALVVKFKRVDGRAFNAVEGLVDAAPGLNAFAKETASDMTGHASVVIEQTYALYYPDG